MLDQSDLCTELAGSTCAAEASWASSDNQQIESSARFHLLIKIFVNVGPETYSKETVGDFRFIANFAPPPSARRSSQCGAHACSLYHRVVTMALDEALPDHRIANTFEIWFGRNAKAVLFRSLSQWWRPREEEEERCRCWKAGVRGSFGPLLSNGDKESCLLLYCW